MDAAWILVVLCCVSGGWCGDIKHEDGTGDVIKHEDGTGDVKHEDDTGDVKYEDGTGDGDKVKIGKKSWITRIYKYVQFEECFKKKREKRRKKRRGTDFLFNWLKKDDICSVRKQVYAKSATFGDHLHMQLPTSGCPFFVRYTGTYLNVRIRPSQMMCLRSFICNGCHGICVVLDL